MPSYVYKAKNTSAQTVNGRLFAQTQEEALDLLNAQGLVPVSIEEETFQGVLVSNIRERRIRSKDLYVFTRQLSSLIKSGVALLKSLEVLSVQTRNPYFARMISDMAAGIKTGRSFSACLSEYPRVFSDVYVAMVRVGEEMGQLKEVLEDLAEFQKRQEAISSKVNSALVYPAVMLSVGIATVFFILTFVMPKIAAIFAGSHEQLPWPTQVVMGTSHFLRMYWLVLALGVLGIFNAFNLWCKSSRGRIAMGFWLLRLPFAGNFVLKANWARFARTTHLLLESGLTLVRSIEIAARTIDNPQFKGDILICCEALSGGESLGNCLKNSTYVPALFVQALTVAEEGGHLEDALKDIADSCENDITEAVATWTTLLEPLMILVVGGVVGFIIFAMLMPIFSMDIMAR